MILNNQAVCCPLLLWSLPSDTNKAQEMIHERTNTLISKSYITVGVSHNLTKLETNLWFDFLRFID